LIDGVLDLSTGTSGLSSIVGGELVSSESSTSCCHMAMGVSVQLVTSAVRQSKKAWATIPHLPRGLGRRPAG
jgi:hypothetical protein